MSSSRSSLLLFACLLSSSYALNHPSAVHSVDYAPHLDSRYIAPLSYRSAHSLPKAIHGGTMPSARRVEGFMEGPMLERRIRIPKVAPKVPSAPKAPSTRKGPSQKPDPGPQSLPNKPGTPKPSSPPNKPAPSPSKPQNPATTDPLAGHLQTVDNPSYESQAREQNRNKPIPLWGMKYISCKKATDCPCPKTDPKDGKMHNQSCINGKCACDDPTMNAIGQITMDGLQALGNSAILNGMGQFFKVIQDIVEVVPMIAGAVLGPEARLALKGALMAFPDLGPSHLDDLTNGLAKTLL